MLGGMGLSRVRPWMLALMLSVLGVVVALAEPAGQEIAPRYPVPEYVEALLEVARGELGYQEMSGVTKYGQWAGDPKAEWCAEFLCWSVAKVDEQQGSQLLHNAFPYYGASNTGRDWFLKQGRYIARTGFISGWGTQWYTDNGQAIEKNGYIPQPGDWMFLGYFGDGNTSHVAMVEKCTQESGRIVVHVIEGNNPDRVQRAAYPLDDWRIMGYGTVHDVADLVLRMGNAGLKVKALQERLSLIGLLEEGSETAIYNQRTSDAVKAFQQMQGLTVTGIANHQTQRALLDYVAQWRTDHAEYWVVDGSL